jgi:sulfate permease, SulP family
VTNASDDPARPRAAWPILRGLRDWRMANLGPDAVAGLTLAAIAIPEQMATARLAGFPPSAGFLALIAGAIGFALFGDSRRLSVGADSTIAPIFAGSLAALGLANPGHYAELASALAVTVGVILAFGGALRFGFIADLLSIPVTTGFLAGIAAHIIVSQAPDAMGLEHARGPLIAQATAILHRLGAVNGWALGLSLGVLALMLVGERVSARFPSALIGVAAAAAATAYFGLAARGVATLGDISAGPVRFAAPMAELTDFRTIGPLALVITLIVMVQTAATTRSFPGRRDPDVSRDFLGVGLANVLAGVAGAFPVDASPPRTAIVAESGGASQLASLFAAALALAALLFGAGAIANIPRAALAGVLFFVALRIVRVRAMVDVWERSRAEFLLILATILAMLVLPIEQGVSVGIIMSLLHGVWTTTQAHAVELRRIPGTSIWWPPTEGVAAEGASGVKVIALQAPLSFLNAYDFRAEIERAASGAALRLVVIEANALVEIDYTGATMLSDLVQKLRGRGVDVALARLESVRAQESFARLGLTDLIGRDHIFHSVQMAVDALAKPPEKPVVP